MSGQKLKGNKYQLSCTITGEAHEKLKELSHQHHLSASFLIGAAIVTLAENPEFIQKINELKKYV